MLRNNVVHTLWAMRMRINKTRGYGLSIQIDYRGSGGDRHIPTNLCNSIPLNHNGSLLDDTAVRIAHRDDAGIAQHQR